MALNVTAASLYPNPSPFPSSSSSSSSIPPHPPFLNPKRKPQFRSNTAFRTSAQSDRIESWVKDEDPPASLSGSSSSARTQLNLLEQLTSTTSSSVDGGYESDGSSRKLTIRDQLAQLIGDRDGDFSIPLGKNFKKVIAKELTISQKRNIKRQAYLNEVSKRNDSVFFATIGAFVLVPPLVILGIAILTGYVQLFP